MGYGQGESAPYLVLESFSAAPGTLDEDIVGGRDGDDIDPLGLECIVVFDERRDMVSMAGRLDTASAGSV